MTVTGTVFELLTAANPRLNLDKQAFGPVTKNSNYEPLKEPRVHRWSDFTFQNISAAYGHLFNIGPVHSVADPQMRRTPTEIANEAQVDVLLSKWNQEICREPIKSAGMRVQNDLQQTTYDITMKYQEKKSRSRTREVKPFIPDWVVYFRDEQNRILAWGDSKCSSKWHSDKSEMRDQDQANWIWPFRQILTYCVNDNVRYGYILTPEEIVLTRVFFDERPGSGAEWGLEYQAIEWNRGLGGGNLTINLGLWALIMCSINDTYRPIAHQQDVLPLNVWWEERDEVGRPRYKHHLSGRVLDALPTGAATMKAPRASALPPASLSAGADSSRDVRRSGRHR